MTDTQHERTERTGPGKFRAFDLVPVTGENQTAKDFKSDQEVRWCPGCGDYVILAAFQSFLPELHLRKENMVIVSGIGCSSRFPYYMDTYGVHSIHGRAPAIATGLACTRPDLSVWVMTGDGDGLSIGGNHLIHTMRRNVNIRVLLFNNRIYGLTKGQYSPTSEQGKVTKSTPYGSADAPFNPLSLALGAEATFVARTLDSDRKHLIEVLRQASDHKGAAFVEILQNCPIYNDDAFEPLKSPESRDDRTVRLVHGEPIRYGADRDKGIRRNPGTGSLEPCSADDPGVLTHDATAADPTTAFALSRLDDEHFSHIPVGVFRSVERPTYDGLLRSQVDEAKTDNAGPGDLQTLITGSDTWHVDN